MAQSHLKSKEEAREHWTLVLACSSDFVADYARRGLRYIDCAPEGARFLVAPLQDFEGTPLGRASSCNLGPGLQLRQAYERRFGTPDAWKRRYAQAV